MPSLIIEAYLENRMIVQKKEILKKYQKQIRIESLRQFKAKFEYLHNLPSRDISSLEASSVAAEWQNKTYIKLCHFNRKQFKKGEAVSIFVKLKNIPSLKVKLFRVNLDAYYRKNLSPFTSDINLDGLEAQESQSADYSSKPINLEHVEEFKFS